MYTIQYKNNVHKSFLNVLQVFPLFFKFITCILPRSRHQWTWGNFTCLSTDSGTWKAWRVGRGVFMGMHACTSPRMCLEVQVCIHRGSQMSCCCHDKPVAAATLHAALPPTDTSRLMLHCTCKFDGVSTGLSLGCWVIYTNLLDCLAVERHVCLRNWKVCLSPCLSSLITNFCTCQSSVAVWDNTHCNSARYLFGKTTKYVYCP